MTTGSLRANNGEALREAVIAWQGIIYQPSFLLADALRANRHFSAPRTDAIRAGESACDGDFPERAMARHPGKRVFPIRSRAMKFDVTDQPSEATLAAILDRLNAFNAELAGKSEKRAIAVTLRGDDGEFQAGLSGFTAWGWLFVEKLFVLSALRGQGVAGQLLGQAEAEAIRRGCHGAWIDTYNPAARKAYERQGFSVFGELADFPVGRTRVFLRKNLSPMAQASEIGQY